MLKRAAVPKKMHVIMRRNRVFLGESKTSKCIWMCYKDWITLNGSYAAPFSAEPIQYSTTAKRLSVSGVWQPVSPNPRYSCRWCQHAQGSTQVVIRVMPKRCQPTISSCQEQDIKQSNTHVTINIYLCHRFIVCVHISYALRHDF